ncbi:hypothetical protein J2I47_02430 [Fibrella sp. HMF5335]|uniref:Uncharacterized protein n=1 Tax=Fibrella rubiginis TaxID=2817060 RepID=A0A939K3R1_9BACT|nr:hypothetical protein [Fibrella rubiginis]MBO0935396.1 hypothetical protein [Fibrella rubiginis]
MKRALTTRVAVCLLTSGLFYTSTMVALASPSQSVNRPAQEASRTTTARTKSAETRSTPVKSSPEVAVAKPTPKKDAPGKRFWGRIMDHFREIHSAEKKPK